VVATIYGLASMGAGFGGMIFALLTGWVVDRFSYVPVFIGFGLLPLVSAAVLWALLGPVSTSSAGLALGEPSLAKTVTG
jgi:ACS family hexuronate transporter-like MFS transporter